MRKEEEQQVCIPTEDRGNEAIRFIDGKNTVVKDGDEVSIVPAIAGG